MKRLAGGTIIKEVLHNIKKIEGKPRKMYLFGGHDFNIASIRNAMEVNLPYPDYGSTIVFEKLRGKQDKKLYIKVNL